MPRFPAVTPKPNSTRLCSIPLSPRIPEQLCTFHPHYHSHLESSTPFLRTIINNQPTTPWKKKQTSTVQLNRIPFDLNQKPRSGTTPLVPDQYSSSTQYLQNHSKPPEPHLKPARSNYMHMHTVSSHPFAPSPVREKWLKLARASLTSKPPSLERETTNAWHIPIGTSPLPNRATYNPDDHPKPRTQETGNLTDRTKYRNRIWIRREAWVTHH